MRIQDIREKHIRRIFNIYEEVLGPSRIHSLDIKKVLFDIRKNIIPEYCVGSKYSETTQIAFIQSLGNKSLIEVLVVDGFDNRKTLADKKDEFSDRVEEYLNSQLPPILQLPPRDHS